MSPERSYRVGPNNTPMRSFRASDAVWAAALARAKVEGKSMTDVLVELLTRYGRGKPRLPKKD